MQIGLPRIGLETIPVQAPAQRPPMLGNVANGAVGNIRFDYILGEDGKPLVGENNNTLLREI